MTTRTFARAERKTNVMMYCSSRSVSVADSSRQRLAQRRVRYRGVALTWTAIMLLLMILLLGLMIDTAKVAYNLHELQNAADAAALAGAQIVKVAMPDVTRQWTHDLAFTNAAEGLGVTLRTTAQPEPFVDDTNLDIILGRWINHQRRFFPTLDTPDAVKVIARRADGLAGAPALAMIFGPIAGVPTVGVNRKAIGWHNAVSGAGLILLDPDAEPGLYVPGTGDVRVIGGSIHVNSTAPRSTNSGAVYVQGDGRMQSARLTLQGQTNPAPGAVAWNSIWTNDFGAQVPYDIAEGSSYLPDPLGYLDPPPIPTDASGNYIVANPNKITTTCTLNPGYYPRGIEVSDTGTTITLNPGTYWLGGGNPPGNQIDGLIQTGGTLIGHGVLIYLTKDYVNVGGKWARLDIGGNVVTDITPPGDEVTPQIKDGLEGISIWQDRANTNQASLHGGAGMYISGTLYFPNNHIYLAGNPGKTGNQIIGASLEVHGRAVVEVEYDGRNNLHAGRSILVQ